MVTDVVREHLGRSARLVVTLLYTTCAAPLLAEPLSAPGTVDIVRAARSAYQAQLDTFAAAAQQAKGTSTAPDTMLAAASPQEAVLDGACFEGELLWHYDAEIDLCAGVCADNTDCLPDERCAGLDLGLSPDGQTVPFEDVEMPDGRAALGLCDPFWETNPNVIVDVDAVDASAATP